MIGFVEVSVDLIKQAYQYLENDSEIVDENLKRNKLLSHRLSIMNDIMNTSRGKRSGMNFRNDEKVKLKRLLQEVAYASFATKNSTMLIRIEMASIILDIIKIYEGDKTS